MEIRIANTGDIPGILELLRQVGQVHHDIRPDIFRSGCQKYDAAALEALLQDPQRPIFIAAHQGAVAGYCFCILSALGPYGGPGHQHCGKFPVLPGHH